MQTRMLVTARDENTQFQDRGPQDPARSPRPAVPETGNEGTASLERRTNAPPFVPVDLLRAPAAVDLPLPPAIPAMPQQWVSQLQQLLQTMPEEHVRSYMTGWCIDLLGERCVEMGLPARGGMGLLISRLIGHVKALPPVPAPPPAKVTRTKRRRLD